MNKAQHNRMGAEYLAEEFDLLPYFDNPWSFKEDMKSDNGCYKHYCSLCGHLFYGHKRRLVCKICEKERL